MMFPKKSDDVPKYLREFECGLRSTEDISILLLIKPILRICDLEMAFLVPVWGFVLYKWP
jgi:hypothetical protein